MHVKINIPDMDPMGYTHILLISICIQVLKLKIHEQFLRVTLGRHQ